MLPFVTFENIRKPKVAKGFLMFSGRSKGNIGKERVKLHFYLNFHILAISLALFGVGFFTFLKKQLISVNEELLFFFKKKKEDIPS